MRREIPFPTQKRKANESHKQSIDQRPNKGTVPDPEAYPKDADYLYLHPLEGARAPHCLVLEAGVGGYVTFIPTVMTFGFCNAPSIFQWAMNRDLAPLKQKYPDNFSNYMDDVAIGTDDSPGGKELH